MCGILAIVDGKSAIDTAAPHSGIAALSSRGPDDANIKRLADGHTVLGHTRLSIIDLSPNGSQPMGNENGDVWIAYNGEVYNHCGLRVELESRGHVFRSSCDTEVIIHGYEEWGEAVVERLNGIFAFAIWDERKRRLFVARDRLGIKPLYYAQQGGRFWVASQPKAILADPVFRRELDRDAFRSFLTYGFVPAESAIFQDMSKLPPAHTGLFAAETFHERRYWQPPTQPEIHRLDEAVEAVREQLQSSVALQLVADVPVGVFLSGGVDSSVVTSLAALARVDGDLQAFTIGYNDGERDEREFARVAAHHAGVKYTEQVLDSESLDEIFPALIEAYDEPFSGTSAIPTFAVSRLARQNGFKTVLGGDGGDELFAGYRRYDQYIETPSIRSMIKQLVRRGKSDVSPLDLLYRSHHRVSSEEQSRILTKSAQQAAEEDPLTCLRRYYDESLPPLTAARLMDLQMYLPDHVLCKVDRASMAQGLEVRVPILDHQLVELAFRISDRVHRMRGRKTVLRRAAETLLPRELLSARKQGFNIPASSWPLREAILPDRRFILDGSLVSRNILDRDGAVQALTAGGNAAWLIGIAEWWARRWLEGDQNCWVNYRTLTQSKTSQFAMVQ